MAHDENSTCLVSPPRMLVRPCLNHDHMRKPDIEKVVTHRTDNIVSRIIRRVSVQAHVSTPMTRDVCSRLPCT
jgi:hypothetical protein